jgi:hypothetical protein
MKKLLVALICLITIGVNAQVQSVVGTVQDWSIHRGVMNNNFTYLNNQREKDTIEHDPVVAAINGIVISNGSTISAATSGTHYAPGTSALATGVLKSTTTTGALSIAVSGTDIKTVESTTLLGSGNLDITQTMVGLSAVNNTADLSKPISTTQQTAINLKEDDLGAPAANNSVLVSTTGEVRSWVGTTNTPQWDVITITPYTCTLTDNAPSQAELVTCLGAASTSGNIRYAIDNTSGEIYLCIANGSNWGQVELTIP